MTSEEPTKVNETVENEELVSAEPEVTVTAAAPEMLTPETVEQKETPSSPDSHDSSKPFATKVENPWRTAFVILITIVVVCIVAAVGGYFAGKARYSGSDSESGNQKNYLAVTAEKMSKSSKNRRPHKDISFTPDQIRKFCEDNELFIMDGSTTSSFMGFNSTMKVLVTVEETGGKTFDMLVEELITSSAPLNSREMTMSDNYIKYEGWLDVDHPEYGYCVLELIVGDNYYIFLQGLGDKADDPAITQALLLEGRLEKELKMR